MPIATASKSYSRRILLMVLLCAGVGAWFCYDGWSTYPTRNDAIVKNVLHNPKGEEYTYLDTFKNWPGYQSATAEQIATMDDTTKKSQIDEWKTARDIFWQRVLGAGVCVVSLVILGWYFKYRSKRASADETGLSPAPGVTVPWGSITTVDNTRWEKSGIVTVTWKDAAGAEQSAKLDEYDLDHLVPVLMEIEKHATSATFIPPPGTPAVATTGG
jgi:hypothetical protein